jgi:hypothetical protein
MHSVGPGVPGKLVPGTRVEELNKNLLTYNFSLRLYQPKTEKQEGDRKHRAQRAMTGSGCAGWIE